MEAGVIGTLIVVALAFVVMAIAVTKARGTLGEIAGKLEDIAHGLADVSSASVMASDSIEAAVSKPTSVAPVGVAEVPREVAPNRAKRKVAATKAAKKAYQPYANVSERKKAINAMPSTLRTHFSSLAPSIQNAVPTRQILSATKRSDLLLQNEVNVIRLTDVGSTREYAEVAEVLGIKPTTVQNYVWMACAKLGAENLSDAKAKLDSGA